MTSTHAREMNAALEQLVERLRGSVVAIRSTHGAGSGTAWRDGLIVTNAHVVRGEHATVETASGERRPARIVARDATRDLAALAVDGSPLQVLERRDPSSLRVGEIVVAAGHAWGGRVAATLGVVQAHRRAGREAVLADIRLAPGNSGGPLVDAAGGVVGINAMVSGGLGIAIPSTAVEPFLAEGGRQGERLGITMVLVPVPGDSVPGGSGERAAGLLITDVEPGSDAEGAGLLPGDIVIAAAGVDDSLERLWAALRSGRRPLHLDILRGGERRRLVVQAKAA